MHHGISCTLIASNNVLLHCVSRMYTDVEESTMTSLVDHSFLDGIKTHTNVCIITCICCLGDASVHFIVQSIACCACNTLRFLNFSIRSVLLIILIEVCSWNCSQFHFMGNLSGFIHHVLCTLPTNKIY